MANQLTAATERLERALAQLEGRARALKTDDSVSDDDLFAGRPGFHDNELRAAAQEASEALGRAAAALSAALGPDLGEEG